MDQPEQVSESNHHFLYCPVQTLSSHVQQYWFFQCSENHQWQEASNPSCIIQGGEIIAMLNTMTDTPFSISTKASSKDASGFSHLIQLISELPQIFEKSSIWKDTRSFYLLRFMDRTWLISHKIAKKNRRIHRWSNSPIWILPTRTTIYSSQWSLMIPSPTIVDRWWTAAFRW